MAILPNHIVFSLKFTYFFPYFIASIIVFINWSGQLYPKRQFKFARLVSFKSVWLFTCVRFICGCILVCWVLRPWTLLNTCYEMYAQGTYSFVITNILWIFCSRNITIIYYQLGLSHWRHPGLCTLGKCILGLYFEKYGFLFRLKFIV